LNVLRPHIFQAYRNADILHQFRHETELAMQALEASARGIVTIAPSGSIRFCTASAKHWIESYFGKMRTSKRLPEQLCLWILRQQLPSTRSKMMPRAREPLIVEGADGRLFVRLISGPSGQQMLLLEERRNKLSSGPLKRLGITDRQAEVLLWVAQGKTNPEIGRILGISAKTVHKHTEHIFQRLGVETRTSAALRANEVLLRSDPDPMNG
jgi:DNA-binding CsgD family transcriptional regulator